MFVRATRSPRAASLWQRNQSNFRSTTRAASVLSNSRFADTQKKKILVTGASGQVGVELVPYLRAIYGDSNVIASDVRSVASTSEDELRYVDVLDPVALSHCVKNEDVGTIVHLAAILSATGEKNPMLALQVNNGGTQNVLEIARSNNLKVFCPSTIAVFGPSSPKYHCPDDCVLRPTTMYGVTKVHAELLGEYYHNSFGVDFRSLRYPGVISTAAQPGGGTTDYAVEIYKEAHQHSQYTCYLSSQTALPMIYMPDLLRATVELMEADPTAMSRRTYNLGSMSFTPDDVAASIKRFLPRFVMRYQPDFRQKIAESWPASIDHSNATRDWGWKPRYDLDTMTEDILQICAIAEDDEAEEYAASV